jgi:tetratricopeptide (TPR) repeat protein
MDMPGPATFNAPVAPRPRRPLGLLSAGIALIIIALGAYAYLHVQSGPKVQKTTSLQALYDSGDFDKAISLADSLVQKNPPAATKAYFLSLKALSLAQKGNVDFNEGVDGPQAVVVAQQAIETDASSSDAYYALGYAQESQRHFGDAHVAYGQALVRDPLNAQALASDARVFELEGDTAKAKQEYERAAASPRAFSAHLGLGRLALAAGATTTAQKEFNAVYGATPNYVERAEVSYDLGMLALANGNRAEATGRFAFSFENVLNYQPGKLGYALAQYENAAQPGVSPDEQAKDRSLSRSALLSAVTLVNAQNPFVHNQLKLALEIMQDKSIALAMIKDAQGAGGAPFKLTGAGETTYLRQLSALAAAIGAK